MGMETRPFPWTCARCRQREIFPDVVDYTTSIEHDGRSYKVMVPSLEVPRCRNCGNLVLVDAANRRISEAFRREAGLLTPEEIREGRKRCGVDQQKFADLLGISVSTLSRWETGAQIQQRSLNRLMEAYFASEEVRRVYARLSGHENGASEASTIRATKTKNPGFGGQKMSTTMTTEQASVLDQCETAGRCWALKTTRGPFGQTFWDNFRQHHVIAVGWEGIGVDPSKVSHKELQTAIERAYPKNALDPDMRETDPRGAARRIKKFVALKHPDLVLVCRGYAVNTSNAVRIYGFARVVGPFQILLSADWPWRFKHRANIQPLGPGGEGIDVPRADVAGALAKGSLRETIHEIDEAGIERLAKLLGVQVEV